MGKLKKSRKRLSRKRLSRRLCAMLFWMNIMALFFVAWTVNCETEAHVSPAYPRTGLEELLHKKEKNREDYRILRMQTGLSRQVIEKLLVEGREDEIIELQSLFFRPVKVRCEPNTIISREEYLVDDSGNRVVGMRIPDVEEGDILITLCSHTFGWRNGHAALVIDARERLTLEAQVLGTPSRVCSLDRWEGYPSFLVLRLRDVDRETRAGIAAYARENLMDIPYHLTAGIGEALAKWPDRNIAREEIDISGSGSVSEGDVNWHATEGLQGTHCAHLVWYSYASFGYDLDSDGGLIVTPADLAESPLLEVVQSYGIEVK